MKKPKLYDVFKELSLLNKRKLDAVFHDAHREVFASFDCLSCAQCCKTIPPLIRDADIRRIAAHLRMKPSDLALKYVTFDDDGDQVFNTSPCPFLLSDNKCSIYEHRPLACAEYPHTDRARMYQILDLVKKNTSICPAVREIMALVLSPKS
jgi:Fe-S-cluster containining protein